MLQFTPLTMAHKALLEDFEIENRAWFESMIAPREESFYKERGVENHILHLSKLSELGKAYSGVLVENNQIVARANLHKMDANQADVGYRVSQHHLGKGYASYCLKQLIEVAKTNGLTKLNGQVLSNNEASKHVLLKQGFIEVSVDKSDTHINGKQYAISHFCYLIDQK